MLKFYRLASITLLVAISLSALIVYFCLLHSRLDVSLFPERDSRYPWMTAVEPKQIVDKTHLTVKSEVGTIEYDYFLDPHKQFAYTHYSMNFIDAKQPQRLVDLTGYNSISFAIRCDPKNVLLFVLFSFDDEVTDLNNAVTRRVSSTAFSCDKQTTTITIPFAKIETPHWWLGRYGRELSDSGYALDKVMGLAWVNSLQSPLSTPSNIKLTDVRLQGSDTRFIYAAVLLCLMLWVLVLVGLFRYYLRMLVADLREKIRQDQPMLAYTKLSIEPQRDKEKSAVLHFMATEYANPELSMDYAIATLGMNRSKLNDILKEELGLTFTGYLNKLRLMEAARLLAQNPQANISEVAYKVGYNNASYFNKLFKEEYGCPPKTFRALYSVKDKKDED